MIPHLFLPVGSLGTPVAVCHAACCLAQPMRDSPEHASQTHHAAASTLQRSPHRLQASPTSPLVPCVSKKPRILTHRLQCHPRRCAQPIAAPARWTPRGTFVPIQVVVIAAGSGGVICVPTAIPVAAPGANSTVPPATAIFRSIMAPSFMANGWRPCTCTLRINTPGSPGLLSQGQKGLDERALIVSQWPAHPS